MEWRRICSWEPRIGRGGGNRELNLHFSSFVNHDSGKTSLLFQHAITTAERGGAVLFITRDRTKLHKTLPLLPVGVEPPGGQVLKRIHLRYVKDDETLRKLICCIPLLDFSPALIVVDGLAAFYRQFGFEIPFFFLFLDSAGGAKVALFFFFFFFFFFFSDCASSFC